ncbi:hypothetical protein [Paraburkholderia sprentiae]|uniref:hypothetical protein n=1 Tax=Paraburkholderia sprentiae TaxID=948107 RepID=UPI0012B5DC05|nr:hypothetical protein [Paraburkholderia sprentiae]
MGDLRKIGRRANVCVFNKGKIMNVTQTAASVAMQVMQQSSQGVAAHTPQSGALALVEAEAASAPPVSANGMVGSIINTFA